MLIVAKFGGSSLCSPQQFSRVKSIVENNLARKVVVVSAIGKANGQDAKLTDLLFLLHAHIKYSVSYEPILDMIESRFFDIRDALGLTYRLEDEFALLRTQLTKDLPRDYLVSRGEYWTAKMLSEYLGYTFVDAKDVICFYYDGNIDHEKTQKCLEEAYLAHDNIIVPGFYGTYPNGVIKIMPRGGSDITGSIIARALNAVTYENWTDVSGILMADPRIVANPKRINQITYDELRELSYMGANVLHEETIFPVQEMNIPINILNTTDESNPGTIISTNCDDDTQIITGIAGRKQFSSFSITKHNTANKTKVIRRILQLFEQYRINIEHIPSSIDSFSVVVSSADVEKCMYDLVSDIKKDQDIKEVAVDSDIALVAVVGRNMVTRPGIAGKIFAALGNENINIKMIAQGAFEINIIVGVANVDFESTIKVIYNTMVV